MRRALLLLIVAALAGEAGAGPLALDRARLGSGGGASTGGTLALIATLGQPEAGSRLTGGSLALETGFLVQAFAVSGNQPPVVTFASQNLVVMHDSGAQSLPGFAAFSPGSPSEVLQTLLGYTVANSNPALFSTQPALDNSGTLTFTPALGADGSATVTVIAQDSGGTASGGVDRSTSTFIITLATAQLNLSGTSTGAPGTIVTVPVSLLAAGNESALSFSVIFDTTTLSFMGVSAPSELSLVANSSQSASGRVGLLVGRAAGGTFAIGSNTVATLSFLVAPLAVAGNTPLTFGDAPVEREISDATAHSLPFILYSPGFLTVTNNTSAYEGDVSPRGNGNGLLTISDAVQVGRLVAGLDTVLTTGPGSEFQRADCAPRDTLGDGVLSVSDFVQALRYAAGLDPLTPVGGPGSSGAAPMPRLAAAAPSTPARTVRLASGPLIAGEIGVISVVLTSTGSESGAGLSLGFDPMALRYVGAVAGTGATDGNLLVNDREAASGRLGLILALPAGRTLAAGAQEIVRISFSVAVAPPSATPVVANLDGPVVREVTDVNAVALPTVFSSASFPISLPPFLKMLGLQRGADGVVQFAFCARDDSAVTTEQAARLQAWFTRDIGRGTWEPLTNALTLENGRIRLRDAAGSGDGARFYKVIESP